MPVMFSVEYELVDPDRRQEAMELAAEGKAMSLEFGADEVHFYAQAIPTGASRLFRWVAIFESNEKLGGFMDSVTTEPKASGVFGRFNASDSPWRAITSFTHGEVPLA